jgi:hypothetical protein
MCEHQPPVPGHKETRVSAVAISAQARENREYVRRLLKERQPEFAAALALVEEELCEAHTTRDGVEVVEL